MVELVSVLFSNEDTTQQPSSHMEKSNLNNTKALKSSLRMLAEQTYSLKLSIPPWFSDIDLSQVGSSCKGVVELPQRCQCPVGMHQTSIPIPRRTELFFLRQEMPGKRKMFSVDQRC